MTKRNIRPIFWLLLLGMLSSMALPSAAQQTEPAALNQPTSLSMFGMNTYFTGLERISRDGDSGVARIIGMGRGIGASWAREELSWGNIERHGKGRWEWNYFDKRLRETAEAGYGIIGMLLTTPSWARVSDCNARVNRYAASGVRTDTFWCPPANPQDFADYVRATVERYDGDGISDAAGSPRVAAWQLWNEPNAWETWPGSPAEFAAILEAGYAAAKAADPTAIVSVGGLYVFDGSWRDSVGHGDGLRFFDEAIAARPSIWRSFDALSIHPYMPDVAPDQVGLYGSITYWGRLSTAKGWMEERTRRYGGAQRPIWISEVGWSTCLPSESDCYASAGLTEFNAQLSVAEQLNPDWRYTLGSSASASYPAEESSDLAASEPEPSQAELDAMVGKSELAQAIYLVRAYGMAFAQGIQHLSWFQLEDKFDGSARNFWEEAAIFNNVSKNYTPKAAAVAYSTMVSQLGNAQFIGFGSLHTFRHNPNASNEIARFHLRFRTGDNRIVELLWQNYGQEELRLPIEAGRGISITSLTGGAVPPTIENGAVRLTVSEAPIYVSQNVAPGLALNPAQATLLAKPGALPQKAAIRLTNTGSGSISWTATANVPWVTLITPSGQGFTSTLQFQASPAGLAAGTHNATITITSPAGTHTVPIRFIVSEQIQQSYLPLISK